MRKRKGRGGDTEGGAIAGSNTSRVLMMVIGGVVGGYVGYWIGDLFGWSTDADWPFRIGGGAGAITLSIGIAAVGVLATAAVLARAGRSGKGRRRAGR